MKMLKLKYLWLILPFLAMGCEDDDNGAADRLALSHATYGFPVDGGEFTVLVSSTVPYTVTVKGDWLVMTGEDGDRYSYKADRNTSYDMRTAFVIVNTLDKSLSDTVHVYQVGKEGLFLDETERTKHIGLEGGEVAVQVNFTNPGFRVKPEAEWITYVPSPTKALEQSAIVLKVEENPDYDERMGKVVIVSKDGLFSDTVTIIQGQKLGVLIDKREVEVESEGKTLAVGYRQNIGHASAVIPAEYQSWVSEVPGTKALSRDTLYLKVEENIVAEERVAVIAIVNGEYSDTLKITQGAAVPKIEENADGSYTVYATCPVDVFKEAVDNAAEGAVFILKEDCDFTLDSKLSLNRGMTLKGESAAHRAIIRYNGGDMPTGIDCGEIRFENLELYPSGYFIDVADGGNVKVNAIVVENCYVKGAASALFRTKAKDGAIGVFRINNSVCENIGNSSSDQGFIAVAADATTFVMDFELTNSTFIECSHNSRGKIFLGIGKNMKSDFAVTLNKNTFYNCGNDGKDFISIKADNVPYATISITDNIFVCGTGSLKGLNLNGATPVSETINHNCVPAANKFKSNFDDPNLIELDPQFRNAAQGDFTVQDATVKAAGVGDPCWLAE